MREKLKMNLIVLLLCILINNIGRVLLSTDKNDCTHYKRNVWDDINTDQRLFVNCFGKDVESSRADLIVMLDRSGSCLLYTSPSPRDGLLSRMPSSA